MSNAYSKLDYSRMRFEWFEGAMETTLCMVLEARFDRLDSIRREAFVEQLKHCLADLKSKLDLFDGAVKDHGFHDSIYYRLFLYPVIVRRAMKKYREAMRHIEDFISIYKRSVYEQSRQYHEHAIREK